MSIDKEKKSNRLLASRRYTHDSFTDAQESFTNVLDLQASEIYTQASKIPSSNLPFSGSSQNGSFYTDGDDNILRYYHKHKLTKSNLNNEVWFFLNPTGSASGIGAQLIDDNQQTNFISPKYSISTLANATTEDDTPGYLAKVFISNSSNSSSVSDSDAVSVNNYQFDYKTGVLQFINSSVDPTNSQYVYISVYQYVGKTLEEGIELTGDISGSAASTGSFGHLVIAGNITASGTVRADAFESVNGGTAIDFKDSLNITGNLTASGDLSIDDLTASGNVSGSITSTGSFGYVTVAGLTNPNLIDFSSSLSENLTRATSSIQEITQSIVELKEDSGSFSTRLTQATASIRELTQSIVELKEDSGSFSTRLTQATASIQELTQSIFELKQDSASLSTRIDTESSSFALRITRATASISEITQSIFALKEDSASLSTRIDTESGSFALRITQATASIQELTQSIVELKEDSGSFSDRATESTASIFALKQDSASFSNRIDTESGSFALRITQATASIRELTQSIFELKQDSASLSTRIDIESSSFALRITRATASIQELTQSIFKLKQDSASLSTRMDTESSSFALRITRATASIQELTQSIVELKEDSASFSDRATESTASINALKIDSGSFSDRITSATASINFLKIDSGSFSTRLTNPSVVTLTASNDVHFKQDLEVNGNISGSVTSTGSFGRVEVAGDSSFTGNVIIGGNIQIGDTDSDSLTISADLTSNLVPNVDSTFDIGTESKNWRRGYIEKLEITNITASGDISGSETSSGSLGHFHVDNKIGIGVKSPKNSLHINATDGIIIPVGTTAQRTSNAVAGEIRFNSQQNTYEGYDGANWGTLGGVIDVDQDTKISAENNAGDDNDQLRFFTSGIERLRINSNGHISASVNITSSGNLEIFGNISGSSTTTGSFGLGYFNNKIGVGTSSPRTSLHISASDGLIIPVGNTNQRSLTATAGEIRFNAEQNTYEGYDGDNWGTLGGVVDVDKDTKITAENSAGSDNDQLKFFTAGTERIRIFADGHISASGDITSSGNLEIRGNISSSITSTGSFGDGHIANKLGINITSPKTSLHIDSTDGIIIPVGNDSQRSTEATVGEIRFNTDQNSYEGYDGNNWGTLGGMTDVDKDTKITAENSAGDDNDELKFFTAGTERLRIFADGHISASGNITASSNLRVDGNLIVTGLSNSNISQFSSSLSENITRATASIRELTQSIFELKQDSASLSTRMDTESSSFALRITRATASIQELTQSIVELKQDSASFSSRTTFLEGNGDIQSLGTSDNVLFSSITASDDVKFEGDLVVDGTVTAQEFHTEIVSSSIIFTSGSTKFGDSIDDIHNFTGSLFISGNLTAVNLVADSSSISNRLTESTASIFALKQDSASLSSRIDTESGSFALRITQATASISEITQSIFQLKQDSASFSDRATESTASIFALKQDSASLSTRIDTESGSFALRITQATASIRELTQSIVELKEDSGSFSDRITSATASINFLKIDSGSFSTRITQATASIKEITQSIVELKEDSGSFSLRITQATASIQEITQSIVELKEDSGSFSLRSTNLKTTSSALINDFDQVQSLGKTDSVVFSNITASNDVSVNGKSTLAGNVLMQSELNVLGNITSSGNLFVVGNISQSLSSTGSFGLIKQNGLSLTENFSRNTVEAFELDENGDFIPTEPGQYMIDPRWDLDDNGDLQLRERELWTLFPEDYFSD